VVSTQNHSELCRAGRERPNATPTHLGLFLKLRWKHGLFLHLRWIFLRLEQNSCGPHQLTCVTVTLVSIDFLYTYVVFFLRSEHVHPARTRFSILQLRWKSHIFGPDGDVTYLDRLTTAAQEATDGSTELAEVPQRLDWIGQEELVTVLIEGRKAAGVPQRSISNARNRGTIHNEATIIRLAAQGYTNEGIATLLDTTEGTIRNRRQRIRRWLTALAEKNGITDLVEPWDKAGGNHQRSARIQHTYPGGRKPEVGLVG